jgi:hypothetical protein
MEKPLVNKEFLLENSPRKGGWTFATIPDILPDKNAPFRWIKVNGSIDGFEIGKHHLMPSSKGTIHLSVTAEIRKKIKKQSGDYVHVIINSINDPLQVPEELLLCLQDDAGAFEFFNSLNEIELHNYVKWIYTAKTDQTKVDRMAKTLDRLGKNLKFAD